MLAMWDAQPMKLYVNMLFVFKCVSCDECYVHNGLYYTELLNELVEEVFI